MKKKRKIYLLLVTIVLILSKLNAQEENQLFRLGISFGIGTQQCFPYNSRDYQYNVVGFKCVINYPLKRSKVFCYELQIDPGIFLASHKLLEPFFVTPDFGPNYLELREIYAKEKTITEYVLNAGILIRYKPEDRLSFFILGSIGPMISNTETERLAKGFAFSDIIAVGVTYKVGRIMFDIRPSLRHVSNLDLQFPNSGHNSSNIDFGVSVYL